jgi:hypothetical protein
MPAAWNKRVEVVATGERQRSYVRITRFPVGGSAPPIHTVARVLMTPRFRIPIAGLIGYH